MIGKRIAHYEVSARLGAGGMGEVFLARDTTLGHDVALKLLPVEMSADATARARLLNEARTASSLNHPHICTIFEVGEAEGRAYIALEHVEGKPLAAMVPDGGLPTDAVLRYGTQVADALAHAHERGVIHRDLKTSNVMITPEGRAKVLDFGLAKRLRDEDLAEVTRSGQALTQAGAVVGTLHSMAPELLSGQAADARSDVWALGILLYEMASGALPFQGKTGFEMTSAILREPPRTLPERVPAGLRAVIQRCLTKEPGQRYQRASEVRAALEALRSDTSVSVVQPALAGSRGAKPWIWTGAAIALLAVVLAGIALKRGAPGPQPPAIARLSTGGEASKIPEANEYYERGWMIAMSRLDIPKMREMFGRAVELDPKFAEARAELAFMNVLMLISGQSNDSSLLYKAEEEARRALQDSQHNGRAHSVLAGVYLVQGRLDLVPGETQKALESNPNEMAALSWEIYVYHLRGEYGKATDIAQKVLARNSLFFPARINYGAVLQEQGNNAGAIREMEKIVEQAPENLVGICSLSHTYLIAGENQRARAVLEKVPAPRRQSYLFRLRWALLLAAEGKRAEALKTMDADVLKYADNVSFFASEIAEFYAVLWEKEKALDGLDRAVQKGDERAEWFQRDRLLASLRQELRFKQILDSIAYRREQRKK
jgi:serine/threonine protein kinase/Flp pilus assembly protein TadD